MRLPTFASVVALFAMIAHAPAADPLDAVKADKEKLQGVWEVTSGQQSGTVMPPEAIKAMPRLGFDGDEMTTPGAKELEAIWSGPYKLEQSPGREKRITMTREGPNGELVFRGIYKIDGDELLMCLNVNGESAERPTEFAAKKGSPHCVIKFKRVPK